MNIGFRWGILKERDHIEDLAIDGRIILERLVKGEWAIFVWLRLGTVGRPS